MSIPITPQVVIRLQELQQERKFSGERFYPGAPIEKIRLECERRMNDFVIDVVGLLQRGAERDDIFARARTLTETFAREDTEERERADDYIGETMRIIGLEDWTEHV